MRLMDMCNFNLIKKSLLLTAAIAGCILNAQPTIQVETFEVDAKRFGGDRFLTALETDGIATIHTPQEYRAAGLPDYLNLVNQTYVDFCLLKIQNKKFNFVSKRGQLLDMSQTFSFCLSSIKNESTEKCRGVLSNYLDYFRRGFPLEVDDIESTEYARNLNINNIYGLCLNQEEYLNQRRSNWKENEMLNLLTAEDQAYYKTYQANRSRFVANYSDLLQIERSFNELSKLFVLSEQDLKAFKIAVIEHHAGRELILFYSIDDAESMQSKIYCTTVACSNSVIVELKSILDHN
jgi:hypothetical protein